jgi:ribosomal protein S18 acetylase RimI-like enzyme
MRCDDGPLAVDALRVEPLRAQTLGDAVAQDIAELHARALPDDVLPALGVPFLVRYHTAVLHDSAQCLIGAWRGGRLVGFCQVSFSAARVGPVLRTGPSAWLPISRLAVTRPLVLWRGLRLARSRPSAVTGWPEVAFIAVHPVAQGAGIGKAMVRAANVEATRRGCARAFTKTSNASARHLYEGEFAAQVVATFSAARHTYWYLAWNTGAADDGGGRVPA